MSDQFWSIAAVCAAVYGLLLVCCGTASSAYERDVLGETKTVVHGRSVENSSVDPEARASHR